jgi:D-aspartate ligase
VVVATPKRDLLPALVFGANITALGVLRILTRDGVTVRCGEATRDIVTRSRWYRPAPATLPETSDSARLAAHLETLDMAGAVLFGCNDLWSMAIAGLPDAIRSRFPASVNAPEVVADFADKGRFRQLVERLGIPAPRTIPIASPDDLHQASPEALADGFLKPTESATHNRAFGSKGVFITSADQAARVVEAGAARGVTFMLQEWIPGELGDTVLLDGFVDRHGAIKALVARRRVRMHPPRLSATTCDVTIPMADAEEPAAMVRRLVGAVGFRGIFNVEFKRDRRDGTFKVIELNARPFWHIGHIAAAGVDLPWMSYLDAQELDVPAVTRYRIGRYGVYETPDGLAILAALGAGRRPDGPVLRPWLRGDHAAFWPSDPLPGLVDAGRTFKAVVTRRGRPPATPAT